MKILLVNSIFPNAVEPNKGNFILKNLAAYPREAEVSVIAPVPFLLGFRRGKPGQNIPAVETLKVGERTIRVYHPRFLLLPRNLLRRVVPWLEYLLIRILAKRLLSLESFELIHANFASPDGIAAAFLSRELKIPLVITEHQANLEGFLAIGYLKKQMLAAYRQAKKVICVSEHTAGIIRKADPTVQNLSVIPNGVELSRFRVRPQAPVPTKLIYIGYLIPHKGVQVLLQALSILYKSGLELQLTVVGDGAYLPELTKLRSSLELETQVRFLGEKNAEEVAELLFQHDVMVHPSFMESFGIVLVEALAAGLPVVSTFNGGAESILTPQTGILVPPRDAQALAEGIKQLLCNWESYDPQMLRAYAEERFSLDSVVQQTLEVYRSVL